MNYGAVAAALGGGLLVVSLFVLHWFFDLTAFESFNVIDVVLFLIGLAAVAIAGLELWGSTYALPFDRATALKALGLVATALTAEAVFEGNEQQVGAYVGLLAGLAILAGGLLAARAPRVSVVATALDGTGRLVAEPEPEAEPPPPPPAPKQAPSAAGPPDPPPPEVSAPPPSADADWYPDPRGEKRLRYWNGSRWTHHVAD